VLRLVCRLLSSGSVSRRCQLFRVRSLAIFRGA
jgi:hypothetical protein